MAEKRKKLISRKAKTIAETSDVLKEIERLLASIALYPVSSGVEAKDKAVSDLAALHNGGSEPVRQHIIMSIYEEIARFNELKALGTSEYFRAKAPKAGPGALRMNVYKDMFNYNTSIEGIQEIISLLGMLNGEGPAKLLTRLLTYFCVNDSEGSRMLRNSVIEALGTSDSPYALESLLVYARLTDNEHLLARLSAALVEWDEKLDGLPLNAKEREKLKGELRGVLTRKEGPAKQYG